MPDEFRIWREPLVRKHGARSRNAVKGARNRGEK
jgi:hypothetical protein